jgi:hypothetical protein
MWHIPGFLGFFFVTSVALAQESATTTCILNGPPYQLSSDTVSWTMTLASGQSCVRGLRTLYVTLDGITLVEPPKSGHVQLEGPAFRYKSTADFRGEDSFAIMVSGNLNKLKGSSTIRIIVSVR